jgi:malonyl-CoA O-methyltransferase
MTGRGVFVTGTDTGVGKTIGAACLVRAWGAAYWKPVQTGLASEPGDTETVISLAELPADRWFKPVFALQAPLSPHAAAALEGVVISLDAFAAPRSEHPLVVEGAGGVMVPLNATSFMVDLIERLALPVILVARSTLGTINHTLLSLIALRQRRTEIAGIILVGPENIGNRQAIEKFGGTRVIAELPWLGAVDALSVRRISSVIPPLAAVLR